MSKICTKLIVLAVLLLAATFASASVLARRPQQPLKPAQKPVYTYSKYLGDDNARWEDSSSSSSSGSSDNSYAYLILALQKCEPSSPWSIHGLWPSYANGNSGPQFCSNIPFNQTEVQDLWPQITQHWETCAWGHNSEDSFLEHEWSKHGTCSGMSMHAYFQEVIDLFEQGGWKSQCDSSSDSKECKVTIHKNTTEASH